MSKKYPNIKPSIPHAAALIHDMYTTTGSDWKLWNFILKNDTIYCYFKIYTFKIVIWKWDIISLNDENNDKQYNMNFLLIHDVNNDYYDHSMYDNHISMNNVSNIKILLLF